MAYLIQSISNYHFDDVKDNSVLITILRLDKNIFRNSGYRYIISENHNWHPDENGDSNYLKNAVRKSLETKESILIQLETEEFKKNGFEYILSEEGLLEIHITPLSINENQNPLHVLKKISPARDNNIGITLINGNIANWSPGEMHTLESYKALPKNWMSNALKNEIDNQILNVIFNENKALFSAVDKLGHKKTFFIESFKPQRKVMIVSRDLNPMELISFSKTMGWETTLISSVKTNYNNVNKFSFKDLSRLHLNIDENTAIIIYNNDIKDDIYCLSRFLKFNSGYIGVLRTLKQAQKIREEIFKKYNNLYSSLSKVHMPMGLNLFSQSISEIALAVMSEVLAVFNGSTLGNNEYRPQINMIKMSSAIVLDAKNP